MTIKSESQCIHVQCSRLTYSNYGVAGVNNENLFIPV